MTTTASTKAQKSFGKLLNTAQRQPVTIQKKGRSVAVLVSKDEYDHLQTIKYEKLKADLAFGMEQIDRGETVPGDRVLDRWSKLSKARRSGRRPEAW